jgi:hypothetical protein
MTVEEYCYANTNPFELLRDKKTGRLYMLSYYGGLTEIDETPTKSKRRNDMNAVERLELALELYEAATTELKKARKDAFPAGRLVVYLPTGCKCIVADSASDQPSLLSSVPLIFDNGNVWYKSFSDVTAYDGPCPSYFKETHPGFARTLTFSDHAQAFRESCDL